MFNEGLHCASAEAQRSATQTKDAEALRKWDPCDLPTWLDEDCYRREILPRLANLTVSHIRAALGVSKRDATNIRAGKRLPHPRHWKTLAQLAGVSEQ